MLVEQPDSIAEPVPVQGERLRRGLAIVTGGRRGIGRAICCELAAAGFDVAVVDVVDDASAHDTVEIVRSAGRNAGFYRRDISDTADNPEFVARIENDFGAVTCLVNNAGIQVAVRGDLLDVTVESFDRLVGVNLRGTFFFTQAVARAMLARPEPGSRERSIITITSANAGLVSPEKGPYCISKAGLSMASQQFAVRLADGGIRVHEIRPGLIQTDMTADVFEKYSAQVASGQLSAIRRWGQPGDIARGVSALATGAIPFSTGDIYHIGGGMQLHRL
ncbi:3-ketoacyl-ACP reductase [Mesorhizobium sp. ES1-6]|uniref:3-ketoacyl-ACP reductase n=1 Tax=Mesorhizobium sp. ES1-6 TaxID=2876626 RepID=UPI001CCFFD2D|nr:3-ketoacyl-ACP reductase [Mesorhizobium sp. ES1-6]MBZ9801137.1 3-ketoacyl-ACP reductase [Mesorhizobium sp. ES1-6]